MTEDPRQNPPMLFSTGGDVYWLMPTEHVTYHRLISLVADGSSHCFRGWQDMNDPNVILLYEILPYRN